ncbi:MAG: NAD-dependent epimerase/dehydratase family protein, partial [Acidiferrobacterales bacterium]
MAVFITGGYGHIASWAAFLLAKKGRQVIVYDINDTAPDHLDSVSQNITFIQGDVLDVPGLKAALGKSGDEIEGIIHTVGIMGELVLADPHYNVTLNVTGLINVLELARVLGIEKVLYTSSGAVYGTAEGLPTEAYPLNPTDLYAATKVAAEYIGLHYAQAFDIDFRVARPYFVYGPGKYPSQFIRLYKLAFGALEGIEGLQMDKGADQKLDFIYAEDAARGVVLLFDAENPKHKVFNIATGAAHMVGEVAALAQQHTHFPVKVEIGPGELMRRCEALDIGRAVNELGYRPK